MQFLKVTLLMSDAIGFHGQTIYHNPQEKVSVQIGNPKKLQIFLTKKSSIILDKMI